MHKLHKLKLNKFNTQIKSKYLESKLNDWLMELNWFIHSDSSKQQLLIYAFSWWLF